MTELISPNNDKTYWEYINSKVQIGYIPTETSTYVTPLNQTPEIEQLKKEIQKLKQQSTHSDLSPTIYSILDKRPKVSTYIKPLIIEEFDILETDTIASIPDTQLKRIRDKKIIIKKLHINDIEDEDEKDDMLSYVAYFVSDLEKALEILNNSL